MKPMFVECFSKENKDLLTLKGFSFLPDQSTDEKFVFFNDGTFDFALGDLDVILHNKVNL